MTKINRKEMPTMKAMANELNGKIIEGDALKNAYVKLNYLANGYPELEGRQAILGAIEIIKRESKELIRHYEACLKNIKSLN